MVSRCPKHINEQLLATDPDLYLDPALHLVNTIYEDEAPTDALQEPCPNYLQKKGPGAKSLSRTTLL